MASVGRKAKPPALKLIMGNPGKRPIKADPAFTHNAPIDPPVPLSGRKLELWDKYIRNCTWLTQHDAPGAFVWVNLYEQFEADPVFITAGRIAQLRAIASELGLGGPGSRTKFVAGDEAPKDDSEKYFS